MVYKKHKYILSVSEFIPPNPQQIQMHRLHDR